MRAGNLWLDDLRLGPAGDDAFRFVEKEDGDSASHWAVFYPYPSGATVTSVTDTARHPLRNGTASGHVIQCLGGDGKVLGVGDNDAGGYNPNDAAWNSTKRVLSFWYKGGFGPLSIPVTTSVGGRAAYYYSSAGTDYVDGNGCVYIYLGTGAAGTTWQRFERNIEADYERVSPYTWQNTDGVGITPTSTLNYDFYIDDIRLSDCRTMKFNSLTGGAIGQIASVREVTATGGGGSLGVTDTWLHYDHIGNGMNTSTSSGALGTTYDQDAWGNVLASATTGQWASTFSGRHLTGKQYDPDAGLYYFWQRWHSPVVSQFVSRTFFPVHQEHPYGYGVNNPVRVTDQTGSGPELQPDWPFPGWPAFPGEDIWQSERPSPTQEELCREKCMDPPGKGACLTRAEQRCKCMKDCMPSNCRFRLWHGYLPVLYVNLWGWVLDPIFPIYLQPVQHFQCQYDSGNGWTTLDPWPHFVWGKGRAEPL